MPPSKLAPAAIVLTAAATVVPDDLGKDVCKLVFVVAAWAATTMERREMRLIDMIVELVGEILKT